MKRLLLVVPKSFSLAYADVRTVPYLSPKAGMINLALPTVAALTPSDFEIQIIDENIESVPFDKHFDLVGITGTQVEAIRASQIAEEFHRRRVLVVCGGPSVSIIPEIWRPFADVLIIGEAERIWPEFCHDFLNGSYRSEYRETEILDMSLTPVPDYSGYSPKFIRSRFADIVQTSRGCPYNCEFCDAIVYMGRRWRHKPIDTIINEIEQLTCMGVEMLFLAADNFSANRTQVYNLLQAVKNWNTNRRSPMQFGTVMSIDAAGDEKFLSLAAEAGINRVIIGIESTNVESLKEAGKTHNIENPLLDNLRQCHEHGILVFGSTIAGFDHDDLSVFKQQFDFNMMAGIMIPAPFPLQAPDGTRLKDRMIREGRYLGCHPKGNPLLANNFNTFTMKPKQMTVDQLRTGILWLVRELYQPENVVKRAAVFFDHYTNSQKRKNLKVPVFRVGFSKLRVLLRVLRYLWLRASTRERKTFRQLLKIARRSQHPQAALLAVSTFIIMRNVWEMTHLMDDQVDYIKYPQ